jgi:molecular chaperone IbpA
MTNSQLTLRSLDIPNLHKFGIGFDNIFDELSRINAQQANAPNYPPYNIIKHDEDHFSIALAIAGFTPEDVSITLEKKMLTIKGEQRQSLDDLEKETEYLHRGISARNFVRTFTIAEHVEVTSAEAEHGILNINLKREIPEEQKPKNIPIQQK